METHIRCNALRLLHPTTDICWMYLTKLYFHNSYATRSNWRFAAVPRPPLWGCKAKVEQDETGLP
jgi:hypothetical protein